MKRSEAIGAEKLLDILRDSGVNRDETVVHFGVEGAVWYVKLLSGVGDEAYDKLELALLKERLPFGFTDMPEIHPKLFDVRGGHALTELLGSVAPGLDLSDATGAVGSKPGALYERRRCSP